jgi:hypothetical protein
MAIKLNDLLKIPNLSNVKIRFNIKSNRIGFDPIKEYHQSRESILISNYYNSEKRVWFNEGDIVIGLLQMNKENCWLLFDIAKITKNYHKYSVQNAQSNTFYEHEPLGEYSDYFGRLIVKIHKSWQMPIRNANTVIDNIEVSELLPSEFDQLNTFPGYDSVDLSWLELKTVLERDNWKTALENQKGIYLITDIATNKRYVGSAYGQNMMLGRWNEYASTRHGNNVELKNLVDEKGEKYIEENFRYTILEIHKNLTPDDTIIKRESFWKEILLTRNPDYGYNNN